VRENRLPAETAKSRKGAKTSMTKLERKPQKTGRSAPENVIHLRPVEIGVESKQFPDRH
jgi:hypothetical protein